MLQRPSRKERARAYQRAYEARSHAGVGLYLVPLTHTELDVLDALGRLKEGDDVDRARGRPGHRGRH